MTPVPLDACLDAWQSGGLGPTVIGAGHGHLVVTRRGARAVPFDDRGRPLLWLSPAVLPGAEVGAWAASAAWNFGAERLWIGPELRLMVKDRGDFDGSYELSRAMDPGSWELSAEAAGTRRAMPVGDSGAGIPAEQATVSLRQDLSLPVYQPASHLDLEVEQRIVVAADPARRWQESRALKHLGWAREVTLRRSEDDERSVPCQAWVLAQVEAPTTVLVPGAGAATVTDYFEPIDAAHLHRRAADLAVAITAAQRFKVGVKTAEHRGLIACWRALDNGEAALLVRYFNDCPSSRYLEEPPGMQGHEGDSLYVYNDDGRFGHFGEVETLGRTLETTMASVHDRFELHAWWGERAALRALASRLLRLDATSAWAGDEDQ